jgi:CDP-glucose 4,6-dehydratase
VVNEYEIDAVFHLAAQTIVGTALRDPVSTFTSNIQGTWCVLEGSRRAKTVRRVIVASSDKAYGAQRDLPYREEAPLLGRHPYDVSKACTDLLAQSYGAVYDLPVVVTRCGNLFGGGDLNWNRIVPGTARAAIRGLPPVIRSDGTLVRDYFFVRDAVDAYLRLAEEAHREDRRGRAYNFSEERPLNVLEICRMVLAAAGRSDLVPDVQGTATHEIPDQRLDSTRARTELGWKPAFGLEAGLAETVRWYRAYLEIAQ